MNPATHQDGGDDPAATSTRRRDPTRELPTAALPSAARSNATPLEPLPRWFWALPLLVATLWFPIAPFWASDDYFALHYAMDPRHALADFVGPQYSATDLFFFYRPLITLSLCWDVWLGGGDPTRLNWIAHIDNVALHAANALLVACLWRRLLPDRVAFCAGLIWALMPGHIGGIAWAVGRTDGTSALFGLACVLLFARWREGLQRTRLPSLVMMLLALLCKETVLCLPGVIALVAFAHTTAAGPVGRARSALAAMSPYAALLAVYLVFRIAVLGTLGGYTAAAYDPIAIARGTTDYLLDLVNPLRWSHAVEVLPPAVAGHAALPWLGYLPAALALAWSCRSAARRYAALGTAVWFACACVPLASFLGDASNHHNLRYFAFAFAALAGLLAAGGTLPALLTVAVFAGPFAQMRLTQWRADTECARMHQQLLGQFEQGLPGPWFVAGLPHIDPSGMSLQFHFGIDRVLLPPFGPGGVQLCAHRPCFPMPGAVHLVDADGLPLALPTGTTSMFRGAGLLTTVPERPLPALPLRCDPIVDCTSPRIEALARRELQTQIVTPGLRAEAMRLTFFTATGYLGAVTENHAPADAPDGFVDLRQFFTDAHWATGGLLISALELPTTMDLSTDFPVLVEAGRIHNGMFLATHRARALVPFRFDRGLPALLRKLKV